MDLCQCCSIRYVALHVTFLSTSSHIITHHYSSSHIVTLNHTVSHLITQCHTLSLIITFHHISSHASSHIITFHHMHHLMHHPIQRVTWQLFHPPCNLAILIFLLTQPNPTLSCAVLTWHDVTWRDMTWQGYMTMIAFTFFLVTGTIGYYACFWFNLKIYASIKVD